MIGILKTKQNKDVQLVCKDGTIEVSKDNVRLIFRPIDKRKSAYAVEINGDDLKTLLTKIEKENGK